MADTGEFPHGALIGYERSESDYQYVCGGSLISERQFKIILARM